MLYWRTGGGAMELNQLGDRNSELFSVSRKHPGYVVSILSFEPYVWVFPSPPSFCERQKFSPSNIRVQSICLGFSSSRESGKWKEQLLRWEELEGSNKNRWWLNRDLFLYSHNISDTKCVGLFYTKEFSNTLWTQSGCSAIQFNSDTMCLELESDSHGKGLSATRLLLLGLPVASPM